MTPIGISVIIPAFNEELYLSATLDSLRKASQQYPGSVEILVVDNASEDGTAKIAEAHGAVVVYEAVHNVGRVRNTAVRHAQNDVLVFLDADTAVPPHFIRRVAEVMADPDCLGGTAQVVHAPKSRAMAVYLAVWRVLAKALNMVQGATQFCRRSVFIELRGYDESQFMGEDVDFYWRLRRLAKRRGGYVTLLRDVTVWPSTRRFDNVPTSRLLLVTNPLFVALFRKTSWAWRDWYVVPPR